MKIILFIIIGLAFLTSCKKEINLDDLQDPAVPEGRRLRIIMEDRFADESIIFGMTCGLWAFDTPYGVVVDREFNYVTPENDFKQSTIHPDNIEWNLDNANIWIEHIHQNNQILRMHCPIGPQVSDWTQKDKRTAEELELNMTDYLTVVCTTYNGIEGVVYMDVVNETIINGEWFGPKIGSGSRIWENPWTIIGVDENDVNKTPLYISMAFEITNELAPNIKQIYNHNEGPENTASWDLIKETVLYLNNKGLRVDAIGWQAHVDNGWATDENLNALRNLIDWTHNNGMEFHVTEASSFIKEKFSDEELELQAVTYSKIIEALLEKRLNGKVGWNTWHLTDLYTYRSEYYPSIFDENCEAKPAYYAIQNLLETYSP
jgi:GH35 family endo-1,4-beta-xylanase